MKIAVVSSWIPRECGIATFSKDLTGSFPDLNMDVYALVDEKSYGLKYDRSVVFKIRQDEEKDFFEAAEKINESDADFVILQHEFGLFGGNDGGNVFVLLKNVKKPIIVFFHTLPTLEKTKRFRSRVKKIKKMIDLSYRSIMTSSLAKKDMLRLIGKENKNKIAVIYHGTPSFPKISARKKDIYKKELGLEGKKIILTFGLIRKNKGIQYGIKAMKGVIKKYPEAVYLILGEPHSGRRKNYDYYFMLKKEVAKGNLEKNVVFIRKYLSNEDLKKYLLASDMMLLPYTRLEQVSSGVLAWGVSAGLPIISTPFHYAKELLAKKRGILVPPRNAKAIERSVLKILDDPKIRQGISLNAYSFGKKTYWKNVPRKILRIIKKD
ncbi:MAG: glycosyltransferase [Candidatus Moranbacteria bacterium]|jgi:glycosyltransferase involved in cell wall biosynthesis|nr:glycosyltransferase [Candidatus Moranbacteria bacterium]MDD5652273.1 glycosyltransferase [Candidatus Moranbacteria bacterium]MDX9855715.1 glycosyltransferase [Candidatus Moranbacteria bacterium]